MDDIHIHKTRGFQGPTGTHTSMHARYRKGIHSPGPGMCHLLCAQRAAQAWTEGSILVLPSSCLSPNVESGVAQGQSASLCGWTHEE